MVHSKAYGAQLFLAEDGLDMDNSLITVIDNLILSCTQEIPVLSETNLSNYETDEDDL